MALFPGAVWRPIPENKTQPLVRIDQVILHVAASNGDSLFNWWNVPGNGLESHFYVRKSGVVEQYIDTSRSADANLTANLRPDGSGAMSIETEGLADEQWTDEQLVSILALIRWAHDVHDVPLRVCRDADDPGIGWHVMFGAPGPWTNVRGKVCPGPLRVDQFNGHIMPTLLDEDGLFMSLTAAQEQRILDAAEQIMGAVGKGQQDFKSTVKATLGGVQAVYNLVNIQAGAIVSRIQASVAPGTPVDQLTATQVADAVVGALGEKLTKENVDAAA